MDVHFPKSRKYGKVVVWEKDNPIPGDYKIPPVDDAPMPSRYEIQGYKRKELSYWDHKAFCKRHGLVNHAMEGVRDDNDLQVSRWGY